MNSYCHSSSTSTSISGAAGTGAGFSYKMPSLKTSLEQYHLVQGGFKRTDLNDTSRPTTLPCRVTGTFPAAGSGRLTRAGVSTTLPVNVTNTTMLKFTRAMTISRTRSRGLLMPTRAIRSSAIQQTIRIRPGLRRDFSSCRRKRRFGPLCNDRHCFADARQFGLDRKPVISTVPPITFSSGDRSIRGHNTNLFQSPSYASKLATGSLEYQYNVTGKWWGAVFVDSGEAVSDIRRSDFKTDRRRAGVAGWPVNRFAVPVGDKDEHGLQFYIGLGPEL